MQDVYNLITDDGKFFSFMGQIVDFDGFVEATAAQQVALEQNKVNLLILKNFGLLYEGHIKYSDIVATLDRMEGEDNDEAVS